MEVGEAPGLQSQGPLWEEGREPGSQGRGAQGLRTAPRSSKGTEWALPERGVTPFRPSDTHLGLLTSYAEAPKFVVICYSSHRKLFQALIRKRNVYRTFAKSKKR